MKDIVHQRCAGLDIHKDSIAACVRTKLARFTKSFACLAPPPANWKYWQPGLRVIRFDWWRWSPRATPGSPSGTFWKGRFEIPC